MSGTVPERRCRCRALDFGGPRPAPILGPVSETRRSIRIDWIQAMAGALTAVTSAVLLSTVGVAGTLIGAAVGSVAASVGNAVYGHYIALSSQRVASAKVVASARARSEAERGGHVENVEDVEVQRPQEDPDEAQPEAARPEAPARVSWREAAAGLAWRRIGVVAAGVFVLAMGAILTFELVTGRAVSTYTGGTEHGGARTSVPGLGGADRSPDPSGEPGQERTGGTPTTDPETPVSPTVLGTERTETDPESDVRPAPQTTPSQTPAATPSPSTTPSASSPTPSPSAVPSASSAP
jgi:hypothetical protein